MARPVRSAAVAKPVKSPAKPKPAVAKVKKAAAGTKKVGAHPTYYEMIAEAISALKDRTGSSVFAIAKHVEDNQGKNLPENFKKLLSNQLKKCVASGKLTKVKNSYKLAVPAKPAAAEKKPVKKVAAAEKKPVKKAAAVKPAEKKETLKRKRAPAAGDAKPKKKTTAAVVKKVAATKKAAVAAKKSPARKVVKPKTKSIKSPAGKKLKK